MSVQHQSLPDYQQVRVLWDEFEKWASTQRKVVERQRANKTYAQANKWRSTPAYLRNKTEHDEETAILLQEVEEAHTDSLLTEWQSRMEKTGLGPDAWGIRTDVETQRIIRIFQTEDAIDKIPTPVKNVYTQPTSAPVYKAPPPMTSAARMANLSASTSSSYQVIDPRSFATDEDDEGYEAESSFMATTDESGDEHYVSFSSNVRGSQDRKSAQSSQNGSPKNLASSGSSGFDLLSFPSSSQPEANIEVPKRSPDTDRKGKGRALPTYVGPHLSSPEESSDEDDFELYKMQVRIDKIWEFHFAAAHADVQLAMAIQNDRMSKNSSSDNYAARLAEHEKQVLKLQADKEKERRTTVSAERQRRLEEISQRPSHRRGASTHYADARSEAEWESQFKESRPVHLDAEKRVFALGSSWSSAESPAWQAEADVRSAPTSNNDPGTIRARGLSQTSATPSGWKAKKTSSPPTTSLTQAQAAKSTLDSNTNPWFNDDNPFDRDAFSAQASTPVPPIPAGWGERGEKTSATSLLKKALIDPSTNRKHPMFSSMEPQSHIEHDLSKRPVKNLKGRQPFQNLDHEGSESPTTPTVASTSRAFAGAVPKDILQARHPHAHAEDEMSSTPRPQGFMKRGMADYLSDVGGSTPRMGGMGRLGEMSMASSALGSKSWTNEQDPLSRQGNMKLPTNHLHFSDDDPEWTKLSALAEKAVEQMAPHEDGEWNMRMGKQAASSSYQSRQMMRDEGAWSRGMAAGGSRVPTKPSPPEQATPWEQQQAMRSRPQPSSLSEHSQMGQPSNGQDMPSEAAWARLRAQVEAEAQQEREETPWERMQRLKAQGSEPKPAAFDHAPSRTGAHSSQPSWGGQMNFEHSMADIPHQQPSSKFWTPNGGQMRTQNAAQPAKKQSPTMPGGFAFNSGYMPGKLSSSYPKHATVEDEPDEEDPGVSHFQHETLPHNSRHVLDIAVPKPSHPPTAFSDVIDYDELDEEYDNGLSSAVPTPSTAPTSPPKDIQEMNEEWYKALTEKIANREATDNDFSFGADIPTASMWGSGPPAKQSAWGIQKSEATKSQSVLQSAPTSSTTPPKASPESTPASAPAPPPEPVQTAKASAPAPAPAPAPEKPEPTAKTGNQNQNQNQKGKKGKGKGKR
ncbi:hypothetical protein H0H92_003657 [Tricholoma furcatifolium]|nr:hypothetical protein H0H92_003657 [Tricholoma furcatifolium]